MRHLVSCLGFVSLFVGQVAADATIQDVRPGTATLGTAIVVKLAAATGAFVEGGILQSQSGADLSSLHALFARAAAEPLVRVPRATLDRWHAEALAATPRGERAPEHLGLWCRLHAPTPALADDWITALRRHPLVDEALREPVPVLPGGGCGDLPPTTPTFAANQGYAGAVPNGVNIGAAHALVGGRGKDVQISDMEVLWNTVHEDVCKLADPNVWLSQQYTGEGSHGTAVVGVISADRNGYGTSGLADEARLRISSWNDGGVTNAIALAIVASKAGDVILLEVQYDIGQIKVGDFVPAEYYTANWTIIKTATRRGIHVVEAAGNGGNDLDAARFGGRFDPWSPSFQDSGAILVGASDGNRTAAAGFSNFGRRITANGWGFNVATTGYGDLFNPGSDVRQHYTGIFSGTSSATPVVGGAVAALVGAVKYQDERTLTVDEVRNLLLSHGTACTGSVGNRPDLGAMLQASGLPDGLALQAAQVGLGGQIVIDLSGPSGGIAGLVLGYQLGKLDLALNRKFHLDLGLMLPVGAFTLNGGAARVALRVPLNPYLLDWTLRCQALVTDASFSTLHVTSSGEVWLF